MRLFASFFIEFISECFELLFKYCLSHLLHQVKVVVEVVDGRQAEIGDLSCPEKVSEVGT